MKIANSKTCIAYAGWRTFSFLEMVTTGMTG